MIVTMPIPCADYISERINQLVETIEQRIPEPQKKQYRETINDRINATPKRKLTFGDIISIISLLLTLYFRFVDSVPDEQMQKIIAQNEIIISQQQEELRLTQERNALFQALADTIENISDLIGISPQGVDGSREMINGVRDFLDSASHAIDGEFEFDDTDRQQENGNA